MNITEHDVYAVIEYTGSIFGVVLDRSEIPEEIVQKIIRNAPDYLLTEEISVIISSQNRIEDLLGDFLRRAAPQPAYINKVARNYAQKVDLCLLLGMDSRYEKPLRAFGKLRNRFAHEPGAALERLTVDALRESLSGREKEFVEFFDEFVDRIRSSGISLPIEARFQDMSSIDQFRVLTMALWFSLYSQIEKQIQVREKSIVR
jgi:hypothetical protein